MKGELSRTYHKLTRYSLHNQQENGRQELF